MYLHLCHTSMDKLNAAYDTLILIGVFNVELEEESTVKFLNLHNLKNLV